MDYKRIIQGIDDEITRLEKVKKLLSLNRGINAATKRATARPKRRSVRSSKPAKTVDGRSLSIPALARNG